MHSEGFQLTKGSYCYFLENLKVCPVLHLIPFSWISPPPDAVQRATLVMPRHPPPGDTRRDQEERSQSTTEIEILGKGAIVYRVGRRLGEDKEGVSVVGQGVEIMQTEL